VTEVLLNRLPKDKANNLATVLSDSCFTPDFPTVVETVTNLDCLFRTDVPPNIHELMARYSKRAEAGCR
jgi:hypothetical protein